MPFYRTDGKIKFNQFENTNEKKTKNKQKNMEITDNNFISGFTILILNNLFFKIFYCTTMPDIESLLKQY